jgi:drug/metabolite transporter (DMT)-like permease
MKYRGIILLILAEFSFALATVFAKQASTGTNIPGVEVTFFRFFVGFFVSAWFAWRTNLDLRPKKISLVIWRAVLNTAAVILFFTSVKYTSITNANMLNMTYPAFIFLFAPFMTKEKTTLPMFGFLLLTMIGIWLVIRPDFNHVNHGDIIGLFSGIVGGLAIITLRKAREYDSTNLILLYLMGIGMVLNGLVLIPFFVKPTLIQLILILVAAFLGFGGQVFLTMGYKNISAGKGSLVSSSRIIFASLFGLLFFAEFPTWYTVVGGSLIIATLIGSALMTKE